MRSIDVILRLLQLLHQLPFGSRVFSRDVVLGGNCFFGERKCEEYPKNKRNLLLFGGEIQNLGGEISPPKGPEKKHCSVLSHTAPLARRL